MALVFLALNGDGLGHLVRTTTVCHALYSVGERPVIFSQGIFPLNDQSNIPGKRIPSLWKAGVSVRRAVSSELRSMAELSLPSVLVEDTHPNPIELPANIRRVLLVRPTFFEYLCTLNQQSGRTYSAFLLCDHPGSPTWPYSQEQTEAILKWDRWFIVGPIYRSMEQADIDAVRGRYRLTTEDRLFVVSSGGGGQHVDTEAEVFVARATEIAERIRNSDDASRFIFIKGPYFSPEVKIGPPFEVVEQEPLMPALLATARCAFIRAGFNTPWECISAGTPFLPYIGATVVEPVEARLQGMGRLGLLPDNLNQAWHDEPWREHYRKTCHALTNNFPGMPDGLLFQKLILGDIAKRSTVAVQDHTHTPQARVADRPISVKLKKSLQFSIRIDEVTTVEPALSWLLEFLAARGLRASLGVVPYFLGFDASLLDVYDPAGSLFEVAQHGCTSISRSWVGHMPQEFSLDCAHPPGKESRDLARGKQQLRQVFTTRWKGGFSAPFDAMPYWLPLLWKDLGGTFIMRIAENSGTQAPLPSVHGAADLGGGSAGWIQSRQWTARQLAYQSVRSGHVGIVLSPRCLRSARARARFVELVDFIQARGVETASLSDIALGQKTAPRGVALSNLLWALKTWTLG